MFNTETVGFRDRRSVWFCRADLCFGGREDFVEQDDLFPPDDPGYFCGTALPCHDDPE